MKPFLLFLVIISFLSPKNKQSSYDIVIYGGTSAGVVAAVQGARMGKSVLLICQRNHVGGLSSSGLGWTDLGRAKTIGGISLSFYQELFRYYESNKAWKRETREEFTRRVKSGNQWESVMLPSNGIMPVFEPHVAEEIFEKFLNENKIEVIREGLLNRQSGVVKSGNSIISLSLMNGKMITAKQFIDASYEGDLMAAAGVSYTIGRERNDKFQEQFNGIQAANARLNQVQTGIDPFVVKGDPSSGLLPGINSNAGGVDGEGDYKIQAYCYRMCLTNDPANRVMVTRPSHYKEQDFEIVLRAAEAGTTNFFKLDKMPNKKTDSNNSGGVSTDYIGMNYNYPEAGYEERKEIENAHIYWQSGLLWTIQNHPRVPEATRLMFKDWGLSKDEFSDNGHWPYQIYVREARRMISDMVISEKYCLNQVKSLKPVTLGSYTMDSHNTQRYIARSELMGYEIRNEGDVQMPVPHPYPIDFGSLVPKANEVDNLSVPVCLSATHIAYGSIRMEPVFMMLGQVAATAAAFAIDEKVTIQAIDYGKLKKQLLKDNMKLSAE